MDKHNPYSPNPNDVEALAANICELNLICK
jgi:hypothetical protein